MAVIELVGAVVFTFVFAILYEGLKSLRQWLLYYDYKHYSKSASNNESGDTQRLINVGHNKQRYVVHTPLMRIVM